LDRLFVPARANDPFHIAIGKFHVSGRVSNEYAVTRLVVVAVVAAALININISIPLLLPIITTIIIIMIIDKGNHGGNCPGVIDRDDHGTIVFHERHGRIGRPQINAHTDRCFCSSWLFFIVGRRVGGVSSTGAAAAAAPSRQRTKSAVLLLPSTPHIMHLAAGSTLSR
jgi:hypothetical protein